MKKIIFTSTLIAGLLTASQLASAIDASPVCPLLSTVISNQPITGAEVSYENPTRYTLTTKNYSTDNTHDADYLSGKAQYKYTNSNFSILGVKADSAEDAIIKTQKVLAEISTTSSAPVARIEKSYGNYYICYYNLDFSKFGDNYNNIYPVAKVEFNS